MKYFLLILLFCIELFADARVFVYHRFDEAKHPYTNTSMEDLKKQFEFLKKNNYKVVSTLDIVEKIKNKEKIPSNWVAFNIDDSYKSFYTKALPLFKKYKYPFTLFVYVKATQKKYPDFMTWKEIKESSKYGEIALHSYAHGHLTHYSNEKIKKDTKIAFELFEKNLGFKPKGYVYPYGEYDSRVKKIIKSFGFEYIANQNNGSISQNTDIFDLPRIALVGKVKIKNKIKYTTLDATWIEPKSYPKDGILKRIKVKINPKIKKAKLYISKYGWEDIKVKNGTIDVQVNKKLKLNRNRVAISTDYYTITNKLLIK